MSQDINPQPVHEGSAEKTAKRGDHALAAEAERNAAEAGRNTAEAERNAAEAGRNAAEAGRSAAEAERNAAEAERNAAEAGRIGQSPSPDANHSGLALAAEAGRILLQNGAEISRVEETMERIARHYGESGEQFFVLSNGIFTTGRSFAKVEFIPIKGARLDKVVQINQLSREIAEGKHSLEQAWQRLEFIKSQPEKPVWEQLLAAFLGCGAFCIIFGGSLFDALASAIAATLLNLVVLKLLNPWFSKACNSIVAGFLGSLFCVCLFKLGIGAHLADMIVGTLILLIPGVAFTNGLRDVAGEDYLAGLTRLADALMIFLCIALGSFLAILSVQQFSAQDLFIHGTVTDSLTANYAIQLAAAFIGTGAFAVLFGVPRKHYWSCALVGMLGWAIYLLVLRELHAGAFFAAALGSMVVALCSRFAAVKLRCPSTVFLICGIFPLIPGGGVFWSAYYAAQGDISLALHIGFDSVKIAFAMVIVLIIVSNIFHRK